jgi:uncharacterized protein YigE (DUF2233 family)
MALNTIRTDLHPPTLYATVAVSTAAVLHTTAAPTNAQHLPSFVCFNGGASGGNAVFKDQAGTTITYALQAGQMLVIGGVAEITAANACVVLVGWNPEP